MKYMYGIIMNVFFLNNSIKKVIFLLYGFCRQIDYKMIMKKREGKIRGLEICDFNVLLILKMNKIIISSRASKLAVWQTNYIADQLLVKN